MNDITKPQNLPEPIGPYSQSIQIENFLVLSGQIPIDIQSHCIPENIAEQTLLVLNNIKRIVINSGFSVQNIVKTTIFTTELKQIHIINKIYMKFFLDNKSKFPARSCVEVQALPKNVKIEIEAMALKKRINN